MAQTISNSQDIMDSRDIMARVRELESDLTDSEAREELGMLLTVIEEINANAGDLAEDGVTLIRDSYFESYARELAEDIGAIKSDLGWPYDYIDWERAADALKQDYSSIDFDGVEYWVRS